MRYGRRARWPTDWPIDPWPRASLGERLSIAFVLVFVLLVTFCAAGAACILIAALTLHVYRSFDVGASLRTAIARRAGRAPSAAAAREARAPSQEMVLRKTA